MIHVLGEGKDTKGISLKISFNDISKETCVVVWKDELVKTVRFSANRFGFHLSDSVKALSLADTMAKEIETELAL